MAAHSPPLPSASWSGARPGCSSGLRLSPLPAWALIVSILISTMIVALVQVVRVLSIDPRRPGSPAALVAFVTRLVLGSRFSAMELAMSTVIPNQEIAGPVTSIVFFVLLFLSGLWFPLKAHSGLAMLSNYFPVRPFLLAVSAPFEFQAGVSPWAWHDLLVVAIWGGAARGCPATIPLVASPELTLRDVGQRRSKRSRFMTFSHAAAKSSTNFCLESSLA